MTGWKRGRLRSSPTPSAWLLAQDQGNNRGKDRPEDCKTNRHAQERFDVAGLAPLLHQLRSHYRQEKNKIKTGQNCIRDRDRNAGDESLCESQRIAISDSLFLDPHHQADDRREVEYGDVGKLSTRAFKVQHEMLQ